MQDETQAVAEESASTRSSALARIKTAMRQLGEKGVTVAVKEHILPDPDENKIEVTVADRMPREMTSRAEVATYLEEAVRWL